MDIEALEFRAACLQAARNFFITHGYLELDTPALAPALIPESCLEVFRTEYLKPFKIGEEAAVPLFLVPSPEVFIKPVIAAHGRSVFQLSKCYRNCESVGHIHNPEFTMLEWYRPHFDMYRLINEVDDLLQQILECPPAESMSYQFAFQQYVGLDPLSAELSDLVEKAKKYQLVDAEKENRDTLLQFLFSAVVEPQIGHDSPVVVYHFPASQAALAQISSEDLRVAERFEFYYKGLELANGFHELADVREQLHRFELDNRQREKAGLPAHDIDKRLLGALQAGIPDCSGVALGVDRLFMIAMGAKSIKEVISFAIDNA